MILKELKLKNFRGFTDTVIEFDDNLNFIIGRNDVGKSTILEALDIFFNADKVKMELGDLSVYAKTQTVSISCCFCIENDSILIDSTNYTSCKDEFILNEKGYLEIKKEWDCSKGKLTASSLKTYIVANYPKQYESPLLLEKIKTLQSIYDKYKENPVYVPEKRTISAELRKAIYSIELSEFPELKMTDIDISKEGAKDIWDSLSKQLPLYFLFESDRKNTDKDAEIQDPLKAITKSVIASMEAEIQKMQDNVRIQVEDIGKRTIEKLADLDPNIAKDITPKVSLKPIDTAFSFDLVADNNIPLNKRGSGVRRLILLSYFRADSEEALLENSNKKMIYAIEEPETSQHPDYQKMIFETLFELSEKPTHQIIATTHTPEIAKMLNIEQLIFIKKDEDIPYVETNNEIKKSEIVKTLGILPYANSKVVLYVEGENDVSFLSNLNKNIPELNSIIDLEKEDISIIPLNGSKLIDWINKDYFEFAGVSEIYIVDNDVNEYLEKIEEINITNDHRRFGWHTSLREMENYCPIELVEDEFKIDLSKYKTTWQSLDIPKILMDICKTEINDNKQREKVIKKIINSSISKKITKSQLVANGTWDEIENWFKKISAINNNCIIKTTK